MAVQILSPELGFLSHFGCEGAMTAAAAVFWRVEVQKWCCSVFAVVADGESLPLLLRVAVMVDSNAKTVVKLAARR